MKWTKYKWRGEEFYLSKICKTYFAETGKKISPETLRSRLKVTNGCVDSALGNYKRKKTGPKKHLCPDGKIRTAKQIYEHLGISKSGWASRLYKYDGDIEMAWSVGENMNANNYARNTPNTPRNMPKISRKAAAAAKARMVRGEITETKAAIEAHRVQMALDAIPSPTKYEQTLYA